MLTSEQLANFVTELKNISLSDVTLDMSYMTITQINAKTFAYCDEIISVILPPCVTSIGSYAFYGCNNLTSVTIAEGVTIIGTYTFAFCSALKEVTIPDFVTSLGDCAFYNCIALETVTIGSGVTTISSSDAISGGAFGYCSALKTVYYNGTKDEWGEISIKGTDSKVGNYYLKIATIICTDGTYTY